MRVLMCTFVFIAVITAHPTERENFQTTPEKTEPAILAEPAISLEGMIAELNSTLSSVISEIRHNGNTGDIDIAELKAASPSISPIPLDNRSGTGLLQNVTTTTAPTTGTMSRPAVSHLNSSGRSDAQTATITGAQSPRIVAINSTGGDSDTAGSEYSVESTTSSAGQEHTVSPVSTPSNETTSPTTVASLTTSTTLLATSSTNSDSGNAGFRNETKKTTASVGAPASTPPSFVKTDAPKISTKPPTSACPPCLVATSTEGNTAKTENSARTGQTEPSSPLSSTSRVPLDPHGRKDFGVTPKTGTSFGTVVITMVLLCVGVVLGNLACRYRGDISSKLRSWDNHVKRRGGYLPFVGKCMCCKQWTPRPAPTLFYKSGNFGSVDSDLQILTENIEL